MYAVITSALLIKKNLAGTSKSSNFQRHAGHMWGLLDIKQSRKGKGILLLMKQKFMAKIEHLVDKWVLAVTKVIIAFSFDVENHH